MMRRCDLVPYAKTLTKLPNSWPWILSFLSPYSDVPNKKSRIAPLQERKMVDRFRLWAKGGEGGTGCWSVRKSRHDRHGRPDGGNGGRGGDVILECSADVWDLSNLQHHLNAKRGGNGASKNMIGSRGDDKITQVPIGTVVHLISGEVPSFIENNSIISLDPWDIPGTLESNVSQGENSKESRNEGVNNSFKLLKQSKKRSNSMPENLVSSKVSKGRPFLRSVENSGSYSEEFEGEEDVACEYELSHITFSKSRRKTLSHMEDSKIYFDESELNCEEELDNTFTENTSELELEEEEQEEVRFSVAELMEAGKRLLIAQGGNGGLGNANLGKNVRNPKNRKHKNEVTEMEHLDGDDEESLSSGSPGSETILILELKSIADVGLVGMPNAGKSTLLGAMSRARPAIGDYAFTTLRPSIGNLNYDDFVSVTVADIPGLIKGAHENRGLGHAFLRHIERTKVLAYVLDLSASLNGRKGFPPWMQLRDLVLELEQYQKGLSYRPSLIVANKIDEEGAMDIYEELKRRVKNIPIFPVCAILEEGIPELKSGLRMLVDDGKSQRLELDGLDLGLDELGW